VLVSGVVILHCRIVVDILHCLIHVATLGLVNLILREICNRRSTCFLCDSVKVN
jgi:hypothetical protein